MNAYELAEYLTTESYDGISYRFAVGDAAIMLRQQAKRIEELESSLKVNQECNSMEMNKPVTYWDGKHFASKEKSSLADIPLYTAPHHASDVKQYRELSDEEIADGISDIVQAMGLSDDCMDEYWINRGIEAFKAILKKASEK